MCNVSSCCVKHNEHLTLHSFSLGSSQLATCPEPVSIQNAESCWALSSFINLQKPPYRCCPPPDPPDLANHMHFLAVYSPLGFTIHTHLSKYRGCISIASTSCMKFDAISSSLSNRFLLRLKLHSQTPSAANPLDVPHDVVVLKYYRVLGVSPASTHLLQPNHLPKTLSFYRSPISTSQHC